MPADKRGFANVIVIVIVLILGIGAGTGIRYFTAKKAANVPTPAAPAENIVDETAGLPPEASAMEGWKVYKDFLYNYEFKYPNSWNYEELRRSGESCNPVQLCGWITFKSNKGIEVLKIQYPIPDYGWGSRRDRIESLELPGGTIHKYIAKVSGIDRTFLVIFGNGDWSSFMTVFEENLTEEFLNKILSTFKFIDKTDNQSEIQFQSLGREGAYTKYKVNNGTISGEWVAVFGPDTHGGDAFYSYLDEDFRDDFPADRFGDTHDRFYISGPELFGIDFNGIELPEGKRSCQISGGRATIIISSYSVLEAEIGLSDSATLETVVSYTPYTTQECWPK